MFYVCLQFTHLPAMILIKSYGSLKWTQLTLLPRVLNYTLTITPSRHCDEEFVLPPFNAHRESILGLQGSRKDGLLPRVRVGVVPVHDIPWEQLLKLDWGWCYRYQPEEDKSFCRHIGSGGQKKVSYKQ